MFGRFLDKLANAIVKRRLIFVIVFGAIALACAVCIPFVKVNYNDTLYLPKDSELSQGLNAMYENFGKNGNGTVMAENQTVRDAVLLKERLTAVAGVKNVLWLDDLLGYFIDDIAVKLNNLYPDVEKADCVQYTWDLIAALPENAGELGFFDLATAITSNTDHTEASFTSFLAFLWAKSQSLGIGFDVLNQFKPQLTMFYAENSALFQLVFENDDYSTSTQRAIREIHAMGDHIHIVGMSAMTYSSVQALNKETVIAMAAAIVVVLIILFLTTTSFWEPVLFLITIGVGVLINMGTNILMPSISYMTHSVSGVLQLALTMDYSIFLLDRFKQERLKGQNAEEAMIAAIRHSLSPISASSMTTIASFVALMFMSYTLGLDMGVVLAKGVVFSLFAVFFFLPALIVYTHKLIVKLEHKSISFHFRRTSTFLVKTRKFLPVIIIAAIIPFVYFAQKNTFTYGAESSLCYDGSSYAADKEIIESTFGKQNQLVVLLPKECYDKEFDFSMELIEKCGDSVSGVQSKSLIESVGLESMMPDIFMSQFDSEEYTRVILSIGLPEESPETTEFLHLVQEITDNYFGEAKQTGNSYYLLGTSSSVLEIKDLVEFDYTIINWVTIGLVGLVLLLTFKSALLPVILLAVIEGAIFVNMAIPALTHTPMVFIGYLIVSSILVGATIDYAILLTSHYMENRRTMNKFDAMRHAIAQSGRALVTSAGILTFTGFSLQICSSVPASAAFGMLIARGGLCAFVLVLFLLPQLLVLFDKPIRYSTWKGKVNMIENEKAKDNPDIKTDEVK